VCAVRWPIVSDKSTIAEHIRYALNHWDGLTRFLDDGRIELDTNIVERSIRPLVLNRKNALFAGHDQGAENWACIASLIETASAVEAGKIDADVDGRKRRRHHEDDEQDQHHVDERRDIDLVLDLEIVIACACAETEGHRRHSAAARGIVARPRWPRLIISSNCAEASPSSVR
jgi:hypothetical protein